MFFGDLVQDGPIPALDRMLAFTEARHRVLTENIANIDTPVYVTKRLDPGPFQRSLRAALDERRESGSAGLRLEDTGQTRAGLEGRLEVTPAEEPPENVLFHDRTNQRIERQMSMLAENAVMHQTATEMLRLRYEGLLKAIRGRTG